MDLLALKEKDPKKFRALVRAKGMSVRTHSMEEILAAFGGAPVVQKASEPQSPKVTPKRPRKTPQIASKEPPRTYSGGPKWISFGTLEPKYAPECVDMLTREFNLETRTEETVWGNKPMIKIECFTPSHEGVAAATLRWATRREEIYKREGI